MAKEIELDGAQGTEILTRKAFALLFVTLAWVRDQEKASSGFPFFVSLF